MKVDRGAFYEPEKIVSAVRNKVARVYDIGYVEFPVGVSGCRSTSTDVKNAMSNSSCLCASSPGK
jgi:hypothetical protein